MIRMHTAMIGLAVALSSALLTGRAQSDNDTTAGTRKVYGNVALDQIEFLSPAERIMSVAGSRAPATAIWETLEHAERVECLNCISAVEPLLYDAEPRTREIAAWWLRRRPFGVFGPGETYERTLGVLKGDSDANRRANAAYALGEFLAAPGIEACAAAVTGDREPTVRAAAAFALGRLNDDGQGALSRAMADTDARVKVAAITAAGRVNTFKDADAVVRAAGDGDAVVRRRAAELLDHLHAKQAVTALIAMAKGDADRDARLAACHALGTLGDASARPTLESVLANDPDGLVRDQARIALRRL